MITVFTPTYNRKYLIKNLFKSLLKQTNKNFEWVVVDDGSTDDTDKYFSELLSPSRSQCRVQCLFGAARLSTYT